MFQIKRYNNIINCLQKQTLRIVYKDYKSSFAELLSADKLFTVHHKNVKKPAIKMYKVKNVLDLFKEVLQPYNLTNGLTCSSYKTKTVRYGLETSTCLGWKIWSDIPDKTRQSVSFY